MVQTLNVLFQEKTRSKYRALTPLFSGKGKRLLYLLPGLNFLPFHSALMFQLWLSLHKVLTDDWDQKTLLLSSLPFCFLVLSGAAQ